MSTPLLEVRGLGKDYPHSTTSGARLGALVRILAGRPLPHQTCLEGIDFKVMPGQSLGIIGDNGAGKSTLLKLVTGVLVPSRGSVQRRGTYGALLELGAGFDRERTGRDNIRLSAGLMGWSNARIAERFEEIVAFADIGHYLDEPVKHYSSGMVVRLGFAIIAAVRPDLLITDEVLAVGDESFQKKCIRWTEDYLAGGGTLMLVSHSMYHIQKLCRHALWLKDGRIEAYGNVFDVTQDYLAYHERKSQPRAADGLDATYTGTEYRLTGVEVNGSSAQVPQELAPDQPLHFSATVFSPDGRAPVLALGLARADGTAVYATTSEIGQAVPQRIDDRHWRFDCRFEPMALLPGAYSLNLHAMDPEAIRMFDTVERALLVRGATREVGLVRFAHRWGA